jgi:hypothetical protein
MTTFYISFVVHSNKKGTGARKKPCNCIIFVSTMEISKKDCREELYCSTSKYGLNRFGETSALQKGNKVTLIF